MGFMDKYILDQYYKRPNRVGNFQKAFQVSNSFPTQLLTKPLPHSLSFYFQLNFSYFINELYYFHFFPIFVFGQPRQYELWFQSHTLKNRVSWSDLILININHDLIFTKFTLTCHSHAHSGAPCMRPATPPTSLILQNILPNMYLGQLKSWVKLGISVFDLFKNLEILSVVFIR